MSSIPLRKLPSSTHSRRSFRISPELGAGVVCIVNVLTKGDEVFKQLLLDMTVDGT